MARLHYYDRTLSGMFSSAGNFISGLFKAGGGPVAANQPYIVGEEGPRALPRIWSDTFSAIILIRPCEVLSRIANAAVLKVTNNPLWILLQHRHVLARCSTQFDFGSHRNTLAHLLL